jgi:three-Cys-motif partner protein
VECLLAFNDADSKVTDILKGQVDPYVVRLRDECPKLHPTICYMSEPFEGAYPVIKEMIAHGRYRNVLFNLDQCGHSKVDTATLGDIMSSTPSAEVFYTFAIETLLTFLSRTNAELMASQVRQLGIDPAEFRVQDGKVTNEAWMGLAERLVFETFRSAARFVSPFSIANPEGWRYWLIHFANNYRARQVYNDVLHGNGTQAHFGRSGLRMLSYDPSQEGELYLFESEDRDRAKAQLLDDIPRLITESGDVMDVLGFYEATYNATPAHTNDIHAAMIESPDLEIFTETGGQRRKANTISVTDTIKLKAQRSFFPMFGVGPASPIRP